MPSQEEPSFIIVGIFAHYSDERCELLPFLSNEDGHGVSAGGSSPPAGCGSLQNVELDLISSKRSHPRSLLLVAGHPKGLPAGVLGIELMRYYLPVFIFKNKKGFK